MIAPQVSPQAGTPTPNGWQRDPQAVDDEIVELKRQREELRQALISVLNMFYEVGHPGRPCVRTGWVHDEVIRELRVFALSTSSSRVATER